MNLVFELFNFYKGSEGDCIHSNFVCEGNPQRMHVNAFMINT